MSVSPKSPYHAPRELPVEGTSSLRCIIAVSIMVVSGTAIVFLAIIGPFAWILRDGLGPDSITSDGWPAVTRTFWCFYWGPTTLFAVLMFGLGFAARRKLARSAG